MKIPGNKGKLGVMTCLTETCFVVPEDFFLFWETFFIELVTMLLLFYVLVFWLQGMWNLSSLTRDRTCIHCIGKRSLNHCTAREFPVIWFFGPEACGILAPQPGIELASPAWEGEVLTTGLPGRSLCTLLNKHLHLHRNFWTAQTRKIAMFSSSWGTTGLMFWIPLATSKFRGGT